MSVIPEQCPISHICSQIEGGRWKDSESTTQSRRQFTADLENAIAQNQRRALDCWKSNDAACFLSPLNPHIDYSLTLHLEKLGDIG